MSHFPFQLGSSFCNIRTDEDHSLGVIGAPTDCATTFRSGTRMGPSAIRQVSLMLANEQNPTFPVDLNRWVKDFGNIGLPTGDTVAMLKMLETEFDKLTKVHMATLGGDHMITLGILRSLAKTHGPLAMVHFDAHCDTWPTHFGQEFGHGTWMYNAINEKLIDTNKTISIGIRSASDATTKQFLKVAGGTTISARAAMKYTPNLMGDIIKTKVGDTPCYMSLDIDSLDPAYAPGTGTPEISGLSSMWLSEVIDELLPVNWIGMDCVEVSPAYDHGEITALAAATFVWQYLSMCITKKFKTRP
jgi:agmatinase